MLDAPKEMIDNMISLYEEGNIISILNNSDELITKYPNNATIHNLLGAGFSQFNEVEKSLYHLKKAIQLEPQNYLILNNYLLNKIDQKPLYKDSDWMSEFELD